MWLKLTFFLHGPFLCGFFGRMSWRKFCCTKIHLFSFFVKKKHNSPLCKVFASQSCGRFSCGLPHTSATDHTNHTPLSLQCGCSCASSCSCCSPWHHIPQSCIQLELVFPPQHVAPSINYQSIKDTDYNILTFTFTCMARYLTCFPHTGQGTSGAPGPCFAVMCCFRFSAEESSLLHTLQVLSIFWSRGGEHFILLW